MSTKQRVLSFCIALSLVAGYARHVSSEESSNNDPLAPSVFSYLEEEIITGQNTVDISSKQYSTIVDTDSRLAVHFKKDPVMTKAVTEEQKSALIDFQKSAEYTTLLKKKTDAENVEMEAREAKADKEEITEKAALLKQVEDLIASKTLDVLYGLPGYDITVTARVFPKNGEPFDINVTNYSTVKRTEAKNEPATKSDSAKNKKEDDKTSDAKEQQVVSTVTTTVEHRLYRYDLRLRADLPEEPGKLELVDDIADGIIDLAKEKLNDGDRLEVTVTNYQGTMTRVFTWLLELEDCGLKIKQDATLLLVKRTGNPSGSQELENNFKPAPGSSFMLQIVTRNRAVNFLDPRFGINGSFLDFRKDKDLEIGVGPAFSIFNGIVQVSAGWNLNTNSDRFYWALGLGFLDIAGKIKELTKK
jgi:hypothetical protein